jgi:hypothetical protein
MKHQIRKIPGKPFSKVSPSGVKILDGFFRGRKIATNEWEVDGERLLGRKVYRQGDGPQKVIVSCEQDAKHINEQTNSTSLSRKNWAKPH